MVEPVLRNVWSPRTLLAMLAGALLAGACATPPAGDSGPAPAGPALTGMEWRLDHFQSSDDSIGTIRPAEGEVWTIILNPDGSANMGLFCNRGTASWTSPDAQRDRGSLTIQPGISTMAACPPSRLERLPADLGNVRSFVIADGKLHLNLMMDGGNYVWVPAAAPGTRRAEYSCEGGPNLSVLFMDDRAQLSVGGGAPIELPRRPAASGFLFETPTHSIRGEGQSLTYTVGRMMPIQCRQISA